MIVNKSLNIHVTNYTVHCVAASPVQSQQRRWFFFSVLKADSVKTICIMIILATGFGLVLEHRAAIFCEL